MVVDAIVLWATAARTLEFGFSANKIAALRGSLILLATLGGSAVLFGRFLIGRLAFPPLERWQTAHLTVYSLWVFPLVFGLR